LSNNKIDNKLEIESERRLFYVGITRAKKNLFLSFAKNVNIDGFCEVVKKSRFLNEIDNTCLYEDTLSKDTIENSLTKIVGGLGSKYSIFKYSIVKRKSKNQNKNSTCKKNTFEVGSHYFHTNYGDGIITHIDKKRGIATCFFSSYSTSKKIIYKFEESEVCV
jgi:DNA helicase-2/ATP-dependent DNA helicase PcrA